MWLAYHWRWFFRYCWLACWLYGCAVDQSRSFSDEPGPPLCMALSVRTLRERKHLVRGLSKLRNPSCLKTVRNWVRRMLAVSSMTRCGAVRSSPTSSKSQKSEKKKTNRIYLRSNQHKHFTIAFGRMTHDCFVGHYRTRSWSISTIEASSDVKYLIGSWRWGYGIAGISAL